jgi:TRAP-type C4-dicarboxylate transport system substrate-binding protein
MDNVMRSRLSRRSFLALTGGAVVAGCGSRGGAGTGTGTGTAGGDGGGAAVTVRLGAATANDIQDEWLQLYADKLAEASNGEVTGQVFNAGQLGGNDQMLEMQQAGTLAVQTMPMEFMAPFIREFGVPSMPFLFESFEEMQTFCESQELIDFFSGKAEAKGFVTPMFYPYSAHFRSVISTFPVATADDLRGKNFRTFPSPELIGQWKSWGAQPVPMPLPEVYTALQQGTVDGLENPEDIYLAAKHFEVAPYYTVTNHGTLISVLGISKTWFDQQSADVQDVLVTSARDLQQDAFDLAETYATEARATLEQDDSVTITEMPEEEVAKMREAVQPLYEQEAADQAAGPALEMIMEALGR